LGPGRKMDFANGVSIIPEKGAFVKKIALIDDGQK
jgi:hypothetical protein